MKWLNLLLIFAVITSCSLLKPSKEKIVRSINDQNSQKLEKQLLYYSENNLDIHQELDITSLITIAVKNEDLDVINELLKYLPLSIYKSENFLDFIIRIDAKSINEKNKRIVYKKINIHEDNIYKLIPSIIENNRTNDLIVVNNFLKYNKSKELDIEHEILYETINSYIIKEDKEMIKLLYNSMPINWNKELPKFWPSIAKQSIDFIDYVYDLTDLDINHLEYSSNSFLYQVTLTGDKKKIEHIISRGADPKKGDFPLSVMDNGRNKFIQNNTDYLYKILLESGFNFNRKIGKLYYIQETLSRNVAWEYYDSQKNFFNLIKDNVDLNVIDNSGNNLAHYAAGLQDIELLKFLVEDKNISVNIENKYNKLPIENVLTPFTFNEEVFEYLLERTENIHSIINNEDLDEMSYFVSEVFLNKIKNRLNQ